MDLSAGKMYFAATVAPFTNNSIQRANLDGSNVENLLPTPTNSPRFIALDTAGGKMYFREFGHIRRASLDGTGVEDLHTFSPDVDVDGLALDLPAGKMYWRLRTSPDETIQRSNLDGTNVESLLTIPGSPGSNPGLAIGGGKMYWIARAANFDTTLNRANLDGTGLETLALLGNFISTFNLAVDVTGGKIYWPIALGADRIQRANLDGTGIEDVITATNGLPIAVAIQPGAPLPPPVPTVSDWGLSVMTLLVLTAGTLVYARRRPIHTSGATSAP